MTLCLLTVFSGFCILSPYIASSPCTGDNQAEYATENTLRFTVLNLWSVNPSPESVLKWIRQSETHVLLLIEVTPHWDHTLRQIHDLYPYRHSRVRKDNFGIALFSKFPIIRAETYESQGRFPIIYGEIQPFFPQRGSTISSLSSNNEARLPRMKVFGLHPPPPKHLTYFRERTRYKDRAIQLIRTLAPVLPSSQVPKEPPVIIAGDFNSPNWAPFLRKFMKEAQVDDPALTFGTSSTWPAVMPLFLTPLDHCFVRGATVREQYTGPFVWSDHYPLITKVRIQTQSF